jgi:hypothetical protein
MNNNILIGAEGVDGANFLACCLSMSDQVYFNNHIFKEKLEFFFKNISHIQKRNELPVWSDVSMLFSNCYVKHTQLILQTYQSKSLYESVKSEVSNKTLINKIALPQLLPLQVLRSKNPEDPLVKLFESKYFIGLVNPYLFISLRTLLDNGYLLDSSTPDLSLMTIEEFNSLPEEEQEKIKNSYQSGPERLTTALNVDRTNNICVDKWNMLNMECDVNYVAKIMKIKELKDGNIDSLEQLHNENEKLINNKMTHQWDCNWFLTEDETTENIKLLYSDMNLGECNEKLIRKMYKIWMYRIEFIKKSHIKEFVIVNDQ